MLLQDHGERSDIQLVSVNIESGLNAHIPDIAVNFVDNEVSKIVFGVPSCLYVFSLNSVICESGDPHCFAVADYFLVKGHWQICVMRIWVYELCVCGIIGVDVSVCVGYSCVTVDAGAADVFII